MLFCCRDTSRLLLALGLHFLLFSLGHELLSVLKGAFEDGDERGYDLSVTEESVEEDVDSFEDVCLMGAEASNTEDLVVDVSKGLSWKVG